jgi:hypothetical protein
MLMPNLFPINKEICINIAYSFENIYQNSHDKRQQYFVRTRGPSLMRTFERSHLALLSFCSFSMELASVFWTSSMHRTISAVLCTCCHIYSQKNRLLISCMQMARKALLRARTIVKSVVGYKALPCHL